MLSTRTSVIYLLAFTGLLSRAADFTVNPGEFPDSGRFVTYGDIRFTSTVDLIASNPAARVDLVEKIASEHPLAILISGDLPFHGGNAADYKVYSTETQLWRSANLRIYPALGNHEMYGLTQHECLKHWWNVFPSLTGKRWYSVQLGKRIYVLNLDSTSPLVDGSPQQEWIRKELNKIPGGVDWVFLNLHHPPVCDYQVHGDSEHNVRPNEAALAAMLKQRAPSLRARIVVSAGHIHNYERFYQDGIVYLVSGGGGATPRKIVRGSQDLYQSGEFPNYHYVRWIMQSDRLQATMIRLRDPAVHPPVWDEKDTFEVPAPAH